MAVVKFRSGLKIDLNIVTLVLVSCMLLITLVTTSVLAARSPSNLKLRSALAKCNSSKDNCARDLCSNGWKQNSACPRFLEDIQRRGFDPDYNKNFLTDSFPTDQSSVSLGFTAFAMLSLCFLVQGLAHCADYLLPDPHTARPKNGKQKLFVYIWLGLAWILLLLTWILVLAGSVQAQKDWGLYNVKKGTFVAAAVFSSLTFVMFGAYNLISMHKGISLDAGSEPLTPVSAADKKMRDAPWKGNQGGRGGGGGGGGEGDYSDVSYAPHEGLLNQGRDSSAQYSPPVPLNPAQINVHVAPTFNNFPPMPPGGYVSAPVAAAMPAQEVDDRSAVSEPGMEVGMTAAMDRLRPGRGDDYDSAATGGYSADVIAPTRPPPPPPKSPPRVSSVIKPGQLVSLTFEELSKATDGFAESRLLGEGGFGSVYHGVLQTEDGPHEVAVKRLHPTAMKGGSKGSQGAREFQAEVEIISRVHHRNLVKLLGYCLSSGEYLLAYEFMPNGSLYEQLHRRKGNELLDWKTRMKIAVGSARGLTYLHEDCAPRVIHRDIKASNILLDAHFNAQVADFGLARLIKEESSHITTRVMGTFGYLAPDYAFSGQLTDKSDVYSFGVVLLELLTGKKPVDPSAPPGQQSLVQWAWQMEGKGLEDIVDPLLEGEFSAPEATTMWTTAIKCINQAPQLRPRMDKVLSMLQDPAEHHRKAEEDDDDDVDDNYHGEEELDSTLGSQQGKKNGSGSSFSSSSTTKPLAVNTQARQQDLLITADLAASSPSTNLAPIREDGTSNSQEVVEDSGTMSTMFAGILSKAAKDDTSTGGIPSRSSVSAGEQEKEGLNADDGGGAEEEGVTVVEVDPNSSTKRSDGTGEVALGSSYIGSDKSPYGSTRSSGRMSPKSISPSSESMLSRNDDKLNSGHDDQAFVPSFMKNSNVDESIVLPERFVKPR